jgi:hypothetical protein
VTIAEIRGRARGLGSEFALACDLRFASRERVPSGEDLAAAATVFRQSGTWPGTQQRVRDALAQGLQQRGDFELNQGARLGPAT